MSGGEKKAKIGSDDWFPSLPQEENETKEIRELPIDEFYPPKKHPFKIRDDAEMMELVESVKRIGIQIPILARPRDGKDGVETIAGHRRLKATIMAGLKQLLPLLRLWTMMKRRSSWWIRISGSVFISCRAKKALHTK